ncbi:MAG: hypothetical protein AMQ22_02266 [Candidatus Methanofastidiosum methylothiophilum]|uniref:Caspase domain protein n=1 Tax=Candidatus Methanofastidiosum methylothiophilum TaxID=1705564 RepID=A0A150IIT2_9EURY|nr:MAG: hypothetical protein AMQ22_02266 [Candidatus Methanofastidiosum methylthiophilus]
MEKDDLLKIVVIGGIIIAVVMASQNMNAQQNTFHNNVMINSGKQKMASVICIGGDYTAPLRDLSGVYQDQKSYIDFLDILNELGIIDTTTRFVFKDKDATYDNIQKATDKMLSGYDVVSFWYSGHGINGVGKGQLLVLPTFDLSRKSIVEKFQSSSNRLQIVYNDSCATLGSHGISRATAPATPKIPEGRQTPEELKRVYSLLMLNHYGLFDVSSSNPNSNGGLGCVSYDTMEGGIFTRSFLRRQLIENPIDSFQVMFSRTYNTIKQMIQQWKSESKEWNPQCEQDPVVFNYPRKI